MVGTRIIRWQWLLAASYFLSAVAAVELTRFDGGVAFLWGSTAILIAALLRTPIHQWNEPLIACGIASVLVTGFFGLGWAAAVPFVAINLGEAVVAAWLFRRFADPREPMHSLGWFFRFVAVVGILAPLLAAVTAAGILGWMGKDGAASLIHVFTGHSLGNLTFTPLALLVTGRKAQRDTWSAIRRKWPDVIGVMSLVLLVSTLVFTQSSMPLLFLPVLAIILAAFRTGREGAAIAMVILAVVGGVATIAGQGAIQLIGPSLGARLQFFQFYLAATVLTVLPVSADLQKRRRVLRKLRLSEERFRLFAEHSTDILMHMNADGRIRYVSPSIRQLGGHSPDALKGMNGRDFIAPEHVELAREAHQRVLTARGEVVSFRYRGLLASGETRWFETHSRAVLEEDGRIEGVLSVSRDISEQKAREEGLTAAALTDSLTGLPNRRAFRGLADSRQLGEAPLARDCVALLDIDHFKRVNDGYGHGVGDEVLRGFAEVARRTLRQKDVVARLGGEEFAILFPDTSQDQAMQICERLREEMAASELTPSEPSLRITISGGVAPLGTGGLDDALRVADEALYRAKQGGRDRLALAA